MYELSLWIGLLLLVSIVVLELAYPKYHEGFADLISVGDSPFWAKWVPRRGDVGLDPTGEQDGFLRDTRYFSGYTDVQRLGQDHDFCRMVQSKGDPNDVFFACALGGTEGLSTVKYRTPSTKDGFEHSRDDYMRDVLGEGRSGYCRILKTGKDTFEAKCNPAMDLSFKNTMITDSSPPPEIQTLLSFYEGIIFWLRMRDDLMDYAKNIIVQTAGHIEIDETPNPPVTEGLVFDGKDQFLRIGEAADLSFGDTIQLRYLRAMSFWVYFEEFTNNAHIFDFGDGAGDNNVFCGIIGRGNEDIQQETESMDSACQALNTVPSAPSGAQCTEEVCPRVAMETGRANVNRWDCPKPEIFGGIVPPLQPKRIKKGTEVRHADLLYEIFDKKQRKLHIQVKNAIPLKKWVHIVITTTNNDAFRPGIKIYRNGSMVYKEDNGWLPQENYTTKNYIGKSNWISTTSQDQNADELFKGKMFDVRAYRSPMTERKINDTYEWGRKLLGLNLLEGESVIGDDDTNRVVE